MVFPHLFPHEIRGLCWRLRGIPGLLKHAAQLSMKIEGLNALALLDQDPRTFFAITEEERDPSGFKFGSLPKPVRKLVLSVLDGGMIFPLSKTTE